jgi:hypothetical protein
MAGDRYACLDRNIVHFPGGQNDIFCSNPACSGDGNPCLLFSDLLRGHTGRHQNPQAGESTAGPFRDVHPHSHGDFDGHTHSDAIRYLYASRDANRYVNSNPDRDRHTHVYSHDDSNGNGLLDRHINHHSHANIYAHISSLCHR